MKCILFFFCAAWRRLQTFIHQFIPSFLTLYRVRVTTFWAQMWQITVISVVPQQETQLKPICPYFLDITRKNSAQKCCTLWALYLLLHYPKCFQGCWNPEKSTNFSRSEVKKSANESSSYRSYFKAKYGTFTASRAAARQTKNKQTYTAN